MKRLLLVLVLGGCASAVRPPTENPQKYAVDVTYTLGAAAIAEMAENGSDMKLTFKLQSGGDVGGPTSCTAVPVPTLAQLRTYH
jgi:hypothetical protein